jgi:hypothetical protein
LPATVQIGDDVVFQALQDEVVLLNMKDQHYFGLDDIGTDMWNLLIESGNIEVVADRMCTLYDVDKTRIVADLKSLVNKLLVAGLLKVREDCSGVEDIVP